MHELNSSPPEPSRMTSPGFGFDNATSPPGERMPWSRVEELLAGSRNYWIITTRPGGRPHAAPVWGLWREGMLYFATDRRSRRARNLGANTELVVHLESGDEVVILEGSAEELTASPLLRLANCEERGRAGCRRACLPGRASRPCQAG